MTVNNLKNLIHPVCNIAIQAGEIIKKYYKSKIDFTLKGDNSPLTQADLESNNLIKNELKKINNAIPILSEESIIDWSTRKNWETYWLVDPLDGTKEFIKKNNEFTVNIALIDKNRPVLGVIYVPVTQVIYFSFKNGGSFKLEIKKNQIIENYFTHSVKLQTSTKNKNDFLKVICSRSHIDDDSIKWLNSNVKNFQIIRKGSSLKLCNIAEGSANLYPRLKPVSEWDIAAGHIILIEAGGKLVSIDQKEILYNLHESVINPNFIASCKLEL